MSKTSIKNVSWASRWTFIMAATGSAVGLGNLWKFPYVVGEHGGGAFVLLYLLCIAIVGIPAFMAEVLLGKNGRANPIDAMRQASRQSDVSKMWTGVGILGALAGVMILSFYSVVGSWILKYIYHAAQGNFTGLSGEQVKVLFSTLQDDQNSQFIWHTVFMVASIAIVAIGVVRGVGVAVNIMMPMLALLLLVLLVYSFQHGDMAAAANYLFSFDISKLNGTAVMVALGQAMFTLSVGMGAIMAYGAYMPNDASIARTSLTVVLLDTLISIAAALVILSLVFANNLETAQGPGLMFISLPLAFGSMVGGTIFATVFFVLVSIAALSSAISLLEPSVSWLDSHTPITRAGATLFIGVMAWAGGAASIYIDNVFVYLDFVTSNIMLPLGALLIAIFVGWKMKRKLIKNQLKDLSYFQHNLWYGTLRVFTPMGILAVFVYGLVEYFN